MGKLLARTDTETTNFIEIVKSDDITKKQAMEGQESDCSEDWLVEDDDQNPWADEDGYSEASLGQGMRKDVQVPGDESGPHVRTSAMFGVGLQELLELIDDKLKAQDEKLKTPNVLERCIFERKWRPSQIEANAAAEQ